MRRLLPGVAVALMMGAASTARAACASSDGTLCLNAARFSASVHWQDSNGRSGEGHATPITADTGYFWFFSASNIELVIKVLDARTVNGKFWVFFGALSNVQYTLTVTDTATGARKQYVNASGQFASVGDTKAFDPNGSAGAVVEAVDGTLAPPESVAAVQRLIDGASEKAVSDFTPCPSAPTNLWLNGCRFRLHVDWQASDGRSGEGTGVQLTNDTGYFWFFSAANVELMVKVLDARGVNGNIWVFFGALSNVQYSLTVYDTLTNTIRTYSNPNGTFASVGDTSAFHGGKSVTAVKDASKAVSQEVDAAGGTLTATGADGTVYKLVIPEDSILFPTEITMTPLDHIGGFPFSGGLRGGVQLEPEGLILFQGARLTIAPVTPIPAAELAPFAYDGTGENFILHPVIPNVPGVQIPLSHFSGYGAGSGSPSDIATQTGTTPSGPFAPYIQEVAEIQARVRLGEIQPETGGDLINVTFVNAFNQVVRPALEAVQSCEPDAVKAAIVMLLSWGRTAGFYIDDETYDPLIASGFAEVKRIGNACLYTAFQKCVSQNDTGQILVIMGIERTLELLGLLSEEEIDLIQGTIERCLRFEVQFDSSISVETSPVGFYQKVQAKVPVRMKNDPLTGRPTLQGSGQTEIVLATLTPGDYNPCTYTPSDVEDGVFTVTKLGIGGPRRDAYDVIMEYDPGAPEQNDHSVCPIVGEVDSGFYALWSVEFQALHAGEISNGSYRVTNWDIVPYGEYPAKKLYEHPGSFGGAPASESTHILLKHTPDAPPNP